MANNGAKVRVEVVGDPGGGSPDWVRESWLGVEFEAVAECSLFGYRDVHGNHVEPMPMWSVEAKVALDALRLFDRDEAAEWRENYYEGCPPEDSMLNFPIGSCAAIDGSIPVFADLN